MEGFPKKLASKLIDRKEKNTFRNLSAPSDLIDFFSNDYLGLAMNRTIFKAASQLISERNTLQNGATGSRLLSGNYKLYSELENLLVRFHGAEAALVFNSGYDANIGFFSSVPQRGDIVFYDEFIHASIRDGIKMGNAKNYKFKHNDLKDLKNKCQTVRNHSINETEIYIVTESVFSMDGDSPDLKELTKLCQANAYRLIIDEAHTTGFFKNNGGGPIQELGPEAPVFARIITFGKAMGCHGAAVLGSHELKKYLINFSRSFIYTTGLPPHSVATIISAYQYSTSIMEERQKLYGNIQHFNLELEALSLEPYFIPSESAIHCCLIPERNRVKLISNKLLDEGFEVRPILSPTVPEGRERLRFCLHSYNTKEEISEALQFLKTYL